MNEQPAPPRRSSAFARVGWLVYLLLILYASWYPFSGWRDLGLSPLAFLRAPLPHYWTLFDILTNIAAYAPFGLLSVFALFPHVRGPAALAAAVLGGALLSGSVEVVQTYLPSRVASNLDFFTNIAGTALGAGIGMRLTGAFLEQSHLLVLRERWFWHEASHGMIVIALWPLAQIYPQGYLFGHGQVLPVLSEWLTVLFKVPIDLNALLTNSAEPTARQYWLAETLITTCGLCGALLALLCLLRARAPKAGLCVALLAAALTLKALASALLFSPENAFSWLTPGAQGGVLLGMVMLSGLVFAPPAAQRRVAILTLAISLVTVNLMPANPYFLSTLHAWVQGKFLNFNGSARFLALVWPFFALWVLSRRTLHLTHAKKTE